MKKLIFLALISVFLLSSCHTTKTYKDYSHTRVDSVLVERIDTVIKEVHKVDSIFVQRDVIERDSVYYSEKTKGDTVYVEKYVYKYLREASKEKEYSLRDSMEKYSNLQRDLEILRDTTSEVQQIEVDRNAVRNKIASGLLKLLAPFVIIFIIYLAYRKRW